MKIIDVTHNDTEVEVEVGEAFEVQLPENASTGYQWSVARLSDAVELLDDSVVAPGTMIPGAQGTHQFRLAARGSGSHRLVFELRRPWEQQGEPEERFEVSVSTDSRPGSAVEDGADQ